MPVLRIETPSASEAAEYAIAKTLTSIGSDSSNDCVIEDDSVADTHALIRFDGRAFQIQVAEASTSLTLNGNATRQASLSHEDTIELGDARLTFDMFGGESSDDGDDLFDARLEGYRKIQSFSERLLTNYDLRDLLENLLDSVIELTSADKGFLILVGDDDFEIKVARQVNRENIPEAMEKVSDSIISKVIETRSPLIVSNARQDQDFNSSQSVLNLDLTSVMCVPLMDRGQLIGLLYLGNENIIDLFTERHLELLKIFASQASLIVSNALMIRDLKLDKQMLSEQLEQNRYGELIGASSAMKNIFSTVEKVAPTDVSVLIEGETGTGKELIAHELHRRSNRSEDPFVTINCGAIPENLLESELFGHVKGAFTDATSTKNGKFQEADGGTIFLDEIGEMPLDLQVKLLRVLQEHEVTKVGSNKPEQVDIRVIAATNQTLEKSIEDGQFREDLYYRLNVVKLELPPLRDRGKDVVLIAKYLLDKICDQFELPEKKLSNEAITAMQRYQWPGNVRQLENQLKQAAVLAEQSVIGEDDLDLPPEVFEPMKPLSEAKEQFARRYVLEALERNNNNRTKAAEELGVDPRTVFRYINRSQENQ